jgi:hypothetical protein
VSALDKGVRFGKRDSRMAYALKVESQTVFSLNADKSRGRLKTEEESERK